MFSADGLTDRPRDVTKLMVAFRESTLKVVSRIQYARNHHLKERQQICYDKKSLHKISSSSQ
jgi:hypothetical protein